MHRSSPLSSSPLWFYFSAYCIVLYSMLSMNYCFRICFIFSYCKTPSCLILAITVLAITVSWKPDFFNRSGDTSFTLCIQMSVVWCIYRPCCKFFQSQRFLSVPVGFQIPGTKLFLQIFSAASGSRSSSWRLRLLSPPAHTLSCAVVLCHFLSGVFFWSCLLYESWNVL